ncbi:MAG: tetratricopeptide repeat protein [Candidatus Lokiarchaeota archaeon]|nr:tetratricopeptide repeat protein [Candidatus Lokiarchaeota archaeon]
MVTTVENFKKAKEFFKNGDVLNALERFDKVLEHFDQAKELNKTELLLFLNNFLQHCRDNNLKNEEAIVLRSLGRTHSKLRNYVEGLKFSYQSLKIQKKIGKKLDIAESLVFLAEDLEISGNYDECILMFTEAAEVFHELGKLRKQKDVIKEIDRLKAFSKEIVEDEYIMNKFHVDNY